MINPSGMVKRITSRMPVIKAEDMPGVKPAKMPVINVGRGNSNMPVIDAKGMVTPMMEKAAAALEKAKGSANTTINKVNETVSNLPNAKIKNTATVNSNTTSSENTGGNRVGGVRAGIPSTMTPEKVAAMRAKMQERRQALMSRRSGRQPRGRIMTSGGFMSRMPRLQAPKSGTPKAPMVKPDYIGGPARPVYKSPGMKKQP